MALAPGAARPPSAGPGKPGKLALARAPQDVALVVQEEGSGRPKADKAGSMADTSSVGDSDATSGVRAGWGRGLEPCFGEGPQTAGLADAALRQGGLPAALPHLAAATLYALPPSADRQQRHGGGRRRRLRALEAVQEGGQGGGGRSTCTGSEGMRVPC